MDVFLASDNYGGLTLDFEEIPVRSQVGYRALAEELYADFHPRGLKLFLSVPVDDKDYDYAFLAKHSDGLIIMNYDEHQSGGMPGAIASQDWFTKNIQLALKDVPREKVICAIGNYGYDWATEQKGHKQKVISAKTLSLQEAWLEAKESDENVDIDDDTLNGHFAFMDDKVRHDVWFLDAATAFNEMRAANQLGVDTFALWRLGSEDRSLWSIWDAPSSLGGEKKFGFVPPGQDVDKEQNGEILHIAQRPAPGQREVEFDADRGFITGEKFEKFPLPYQVVQYGAQEKKIALTFDDGPDPDFTPKILDVLKAEHATGTFFLIGIQAEKYSGVTKRIFDEGHEIGNHTWTHPDISHIGARYMGIELSLTERFFASRLGVKPVFFRPPYSIDQEPDTADEVRPLEIVQGRGYITVGDKIDPNDWHDNPPRSAEEIAASVFEQVNLGNIVLLHDGGGNRSQTVKALPLIIRGLRERGYQVVPVSELLGKTRAEVMPAISPNERLTAKIDGLAFSAFGLINMAIVAIFFVGDFLMTGRLLLVGFAATYDRLMNSKSGREMQSAATGYQPKVAVIVPAFNEEKVIERTVRSVLASSYPHVRVIVVDDGSTDRTLEIARAAFKREIAEDRVLVLTKTNSGKAAAANFALQHVNADEEIFVAIDADTVIAPQAIARMVPHFMDARVGAIAGNAKVGNRINIWTRWQALEYITSQNFERRALNTMGAVSVVPGAIGAWRTAAVRQMGNYPYDTVAEDADLTMSLLQAGYKVKYEDCALAYTEAPMNARGLMRQRFRWSFGILQSVWKHRGAFWRGGTLGWIALPNILIFQILLPLVSPFIDLMFIFGALSYFIDKNFHPDTANAASFDRLVLFFALFLVIDFVASVLAFALEPSEARSPLDKWLLSQVWLQRFAYRQLFSIILFKTLKRAFDGRSFSWEKIERTAQLTQVSGKAVSSD
jgi:cellulose synthase/poly-beta-1,6-N-acetylglucosamine synthase-like glycosyltransferase/peptidoglycan/xylan/chitin deacetylase (PgdA/CDA1 family)